MKDHKRKWKWLAMIRVGTGATFKGPFDDPEEALAAAQAQVREGDDCAFISLLQVTGDELTHTGWGCKAGERCGWRTILTPETGP